MLAILLVALAIVQPAPGALAERGPREVNVASYNQLTRNVTRIRRDLVRTQFEDGTPVRNVNVERQGRRYYLVLSGGAPRACRTTRVELDPLPNGQLALRRAASAQSCSGNPCSQCGFKKSGVGCNCNDGGASGHCNHTISSGRGFAVLSARLFAQ